MRVTIRHSRLGPRTCSAGLVDKSRGPTAIRVGYTTAPTIIIARRVGVRSFHFFFWGRMPVVPFCFVVVLVLVGRRPDRLRRVTQHRLVSVGQLLACVLRSDRRLQRTIRLRT